MQEMLYVQLQASSEGPACYQKSSFWRGASSSRKDPWIHPHLEPEVRKYTVRHTTNLKMDLIEWHVQTYLASRWTFLVVFGHRRPEKLSILHHIKAFLLYSLVYRNTDIMNKWLTQDQLTHWIRSTQTFPHQTYAEGSSRIFLGWNCVGLLATSSGVVTS